MTTVETYRIAYATADGHETTAEHEAASAAVWSGAHGDMLLVGFERNQRGRWKWNASDRFQPPRYVWDGGSWRSVGDALDTISTALKIRFEEVSCGGFPCGGECGE